MTPVSSVVSLHYRGFHYLMLFKFTNVSTRISRSYIHTFKNVNVLHQFSKTYGHSRRILSRKTILAYFSKSMVDALHLRTKHKTHKQLSLEITGHIKNIGIGTNYAIKYAIFGRGKTDFVGREQRNHRKCVAEEPINVSVPICNGPSDINAYIWSACHLRMCPSN